MRRSLLYVLAWLAAVVIATSVGFAAVALVSDDVAGTSAVSVSVATTDPAAARTASPQPSTTRTAAPSGTPVVRPTSVPPRRSAPATQVTDAGSVTARCVASSPRLVSWSPRTGWSVVGTVTSGPGRRVVFGDGTTDTQVDVSCSAGGPVFTVTTAPAPTPTTTPTGTPTDTPTATASDPAIP